MSLNSQPYCHPGQLFVERWGVPQTEADVWHYAEFLRQSSGLSAEPPIDLEAIYQHFGMPLPLRAPLIDQQGVLVDSQTGIILIKEDDPRVRQRFTEGHELMELLFDACLHMPTRFPGSERKKEQLCDQGAAELLMPRASFGLQLEKSSLSVETARTLAERYQTSLLATLIRMIHCSSGSCALVMWHYALTRSQIALQASDPSKLKPYRKPQKKLRVWWRICSTGWSAGFIPKNKSVSQESLISQAYLDGQIYKGVETLDFGSGAFVSQVEAMPIQIGEKHCVLSLLNNTQL